MLKHKVRELNGKQRSGDTIGSCVTFDQCNALEEIPPKKNIFCGTYIV